MGATDTAEPQASPTNRGLRRSQPWTPHTRQARTLGGELILLVGATLGIAILLGVGDAVMPVAALFAARVMTVSLRRRGISGEQPWPWFRGAVYGTVVGWVLLASGWGFGATHPATLAGMLVFLASYVVVAGCIVRLSRARLGPDHSDVWIDGALFAVAAGAIFANLFLAPTEGLAVTTASVVVFLVIPLVMAFTVAGALRLLLAEGHRTPSAWLLVGCGVSFLVADVVYLQADAALSDPILLGWMSGYMLLAGSMAHPSVVELTAPVGGDWKAIPMGRFAASGLALTAIGVVLVRNAASLGVATTLVACAVLGLVLLRLFGLFVERERHRRTLAQRTEELDRTLARMNQLLGTTAHDLRNPIGTMGGFAKTVLGHAGDRLEPMEVTVLDRIVAMSERTLRHVDELVDFSVVEHGVQLHLGPVDLVQLLADTVDVLAAAADDKQITLLTDAPAELSVIADEDKLDNVVMNLIGNAIKYSHPGGNVEVTLIDQGAHVRLAVTDEGVGIPVMDQGGIFDAFATASSQPTAGETSSGLGLAIAARITEAHQGTLRVDSTEGHGSTFTLTLPRRPEPQVK